MGEEIQSMKNNDVWDLVRLLECLTPISFKWVFKLRRIRRVMWKDIKCVWSLKDLLKRKAFDYKETFSPIFLKDSFRTIMKLVA
jgi:hypothetical protein